MEALQLLDFIGNDYEVIMIESKEEALKAVALLSKLYPKDSQDILGIDIETAPSPGYESLAMAGLNPHVSQICSVQIFCPNENTVFIFHNTKITKGGNFRDLQYLKSFVETRKFVAHFAQFELQHFIHNGIYPAKSFDCSMLLMRLMVCAVNPDSSNIKSTLENLASVAFGVTLSKTEQTSNWASEDLSPEQKVYAAKDAVITCLGLHWLLEQIVEKDLEDILTFYKINREAQLAVASMCVNGLLFDKERHNVMIAKWLDTRENAQEQLYEIIPKGLNLNSSTQLSDWIESELSKTDEGCRMLDHWPRSEKTNNLKCNNEALSMFDELDIVKPLLEYKKVEKQLSTYGQTLQKCICPATGKIHASYSLCFVDTGRMSCFNPNIQQSPRGEFRRVFKAGDGNVFICADLSYIEVRVFAYESGDSQLIDSFEEGVDPYILTASKLLHKEIDEVTKDERQMAKAILLGRLFLLGPNTLKKYARLNYKVNLTLQEAKDFIKLIDKGFPEGRRWQIETVQHAERFLTGSSKMGKMIRFSEDKYYNKCVNHPVQSDAAACVLKAMGLIERELRKQKLKAGIVNVVHDEIMLEAHETHKDLAANVLKWGMEQGVKFVFPEATLNNLVSLSYGKTWYDAK